MYCSEFMVLEKEFFAPRLSCMDDSEADSKQQISDVMLVGGVESR